MNTLSALYFITLSEAIRLSDELLTSTSRGDEADTAKIDELRRIYVELPQKAELMDKAKLEWLHMMIPGLSEEQYAARVKIMTARDFATATKKDASHHVWGLCDMVEAVASYATTAGMGDEEMNKTLDYVQNLIKAALAAKELGW